MNARVEFGQDQQPGLKNKEFEQTDGVFFKEINNVIGKTSLKIGMVIDLIQSPNLGMVPLDVFENTVQIIESQPHKNIQAALGEVRSRIIQFLNAETLGDSISFSLVAIENSLVHTVSLGNRTRVYLYSNSKVRDISSNLELAPKDVVEVNDGYLQVALTKGDKIVLCTDGLFTMLQNQEELEIIGRYDKPSFGAKHLNSLAKGRNVEDSVTTGVINYGKSASAKKLQFFIPAGVILLAIALWLGFSGREKPLPEDLGVAIVTSGKVLRQDELGEFTIAIDDFGAVGPGTLLMVQNDGPTELKFKTREAPPSNSTKNISGISLFASELTVFNIHNIDYANNPNGKSIDPDLLNQTTIELVSGKIIFINNNKFSPRTYHINFVDENSNNSITFTLSKEKVPSGIAAIRNGDEIQLFCFRGSCTLFSGDKRVDIPEDSKVTINITENLNGITPSPSISEQEITEWNAMTSGYFSIVFPDYLPE
jgi:hypothetical protein